MKQLLFCEKENTHRMLKVHYTMLTDVFIPVEDIISPQKTTLNLSKTDKIKLSDIIIIKDNNSGNIEYIGYIDTLSNKNTTEISCYPLINVFDNDFILDQMYKTSTNKDGTSVDIGVDVVDWLTTQLTRAFIGTDDYLQALPLKIDKKTKSPVLYKKVLDTANLLEVYTDLFINTGVYIEFSGLEYNNEYISGIYCDIKCNKDEKPYYLRYDYPQIESIDVVDNTFTNYNKLIATQKLEEGSTDEPQRYYFYLLNDNSITQNPNDSRRIKQVRSKEITFTIETGSEEDSAKTLMQNIYNELQAPEYNLQITIKMLKNENIKLYRSVDFFAESGIIYSSNITKIEIINGDYVSITLGALRNSLTDFKKKVEAI